MLLKEVGRVGPSGSLLHRVLDDGEILLAGVGGVFVLVDFENILDAGVPYLPVREDMAVAAPCRKDSMPSINECCEATPSLAGGGKD